MKLLLAIWSHWNDFLYVWGKRCKCVRHPPTWKCCERIYWFSIAICVQRTFAISSSSKANSNRINSFVSISREIQKLHFSLIAPFTSDMQIVRNLAIRSKSISVERCVWLMWKSKWCAIGQFAFPEDIWYKFRWDDCTRLPINRNEIVLRKFAKTPPPRQSRSDEWGKQSIHVSGEWTTHRKERNMNTCAYNSHILNVNEWKQKYECQRRHICTAELWTMEWMA